MTERWDAPVFDKRLLLKYDRPGPRYTSYPTAPHFHEGISEEDYEAELRGRPDRPLSLYVHLPFCSSLCYFCACNVIYTKDRSLGEAYVSLLEREVGRIARVLPSAGEVMQLHWGGGTPTTLPAEQLRRLFVILKRTFPMAEGAEIGVELDPREVTGDHLDVLQECGFNRISIGIQDFDPKVQEAVHRIQPEEMTRKVFDGCRERGVESINVDLIYGLPHQTAKSFESTVDRILDMNPDRMAVFNFAYLPRLKPHQRRLPEEALPGPEEKLEILQMVVERFTRAGYLFIGMDHFARPEDELARALKDRTLYRNFQGYTTKAGCDLLGLGVTSIGQVGPLYIQNMRELEPYRDRVEAGRLPVFRGIRCSGDDLLRRAVITRLMCHFVVHKAEVEKAHGIRFDETFEDALRALAPMVEDGLLRLEPDRIEVTAPGRLLVRNIAMAFDAYLGPGEGEPRYSRTI